MLLTGSHLKSRLAICSCVVLLLVQLGPGIAAACEGEKVAKAPKWFVNGAQLAKVESITEKSVAGKTIKLKNLSIEVECKTGKGVGTVENTAKVGGGAFASATFEPVTLETCSVLKPVEKPGVEKCVVETAEITAPKILANVEWKTANGEEALLQLFKDAFGGTSILEFTLKAETGLACTAAGKYKAKGKMLAELVKAATEESPKKFVLPCPKLNSFWYGEEAAGRTEFKLENPLEIGKEEVFEAGEICAEFEVSLSGGMAGKKFRVKEA